MTRFLNAIEPYYKSMLLGISFTVTLLLLCGVIVFVSVGAVHLIMASWGAL